MSEGNDGDVAVGVLVMAGVTSFLTAIGFDKVGWPWPFGAIAGFFGCLLLLGFLAGRSK